MQHFKKFRFFVSDERNNRRSAIWFARQSRNDLYLGPRATGGAFKLSLHGEVGHDGCDSQLGIVNTEARAQKEAGFSPPRALRWKRKPTPEAGLALVARVVFPTDLLSICDPPVGESKFKFALPLAPPGHAVQVHLAYSRQDPASLWEAMLTAGRTPFASMELSCGDFVHFIANIAPSDTSQLKKQFQNGGRQTVLSGAPLPGERLNHARAIAISGKPEMGEVLSLIDVGEFSVERRAGPDQKEISTKCK